MDIKNKSINELKAIAYDIMASMQSLQRDLMVVNQRIAEMTEKELNEQKKKDK